MNPDSRTPTSGLPVGTQLSARLRDACPMRRQTRIPLSQIRITRVPGFMARAAMLTADANTNSIIVIAPPAGAGDIRAS